MRTTLLVLTCGAAILAAGCSPPRKSDSTIIQGAWEGRVLQGNPQHQCSFVVSGRNYEFRDETDTSVWYRGTFSLREDTQPRQFIAVISECPFRQYVGKTSMAVYRMNGDTLTIAANEPGISEAPNSFDATGAFRMELKRK